MDRPTGGLRAWGLEMALALARVLPEAGGPGETRPSGEGAEKTGGLRECTGKMGVPSPPNGSIEEGNELPLPGVSDKTESVMQIWEGSRGGESDGRGGEAASAGASVIDLVSISSDSTDGGSGEKGGAGDQDGSGEEGVSGGGDGARDEGELREEDGDTSRADFDGVEGKGRDMLDGGNGVSGDTGHPDDNCGEGGGGRPVRPARPLIMCRVRVQAHPRKLLRRLWGIFRWGDWIWRWIVTGTKRPCSQCRPRHEMGLRALPRTLRPQNRTFVAQRGERRSPLGNAPSGRSG